MAFVNHVRLSVNIATDVSDALKALSYRHDVTVTETIRRAIAILKLVSDENERGNRVMVVQGEGESATFRELILL
jgi:hypothetical protein